MSKQSEFAVILGLNPLFANLGAEALNRIAALCHTQHLAPKEVLFQKGDSGDALYGIRRGQIRIETGTSGGGQLTLNFLGSGDLFGEIAARHAGLKLIVDHMGALRGAKGKAAFPKMQELTALAKYPNVAVKLTGGPFYADDAYPFRSLDQHYRAMYDAFGPRRLFWGTDITKMPCSWRQCVSHFQEITWMPEADKKLIMGKAICQWLGWQR